MDTHKNARLTPKGREEMVRAVVHGGLTKVAAARRFNSTPKTVAKWVDRFNAEGVDGLRDRSSRPLSSPSQTPAATCTAVEALRRQRHSGKQIASEPHDLACDRQSDPATSGAQQTKCTGTCRADPPVRARSSR